MKSNNPVYRLVGTFLCAIVIFLQSASSSAGTIAKSDNTDALNLTNSWVGGVVPGSADVALWNSTVTGANSSALGGSLSWQGIQILNPGGAATIANTAGASLTLGSSGIDLVSPSQALTLACSNNLGSAQTWNVAGGRTLTVSGSIAGPSDATLTIAGSGRAVFGSRDSTFTNDIIINGGTLSATVAARNTGGASGNATALGRLLSSRTITVNSGGTLTFTNANDVFAAGGTSSQVPAPLLVVNSGGTLIIGGMGGNNYGNDFGRITLNGGTINLLNGYSSTYGAAMLTDTITVGGSVASTISSNGTANSVASLGYSGSTVGTTFDVADATGNANADLIVSASLRNAPNVGANPTSLTKTGSGTMRLDAANGYTGKTVIVAGTLALGVNGSSASGAFQVNSGATFDVTAQAGSSYTFGSGKVLTNGSSAGTATINATGGTVTLILGAAPGFTALGGVSPTVGKIHVIGNLSLDDNTVTVNVTGAALGAGTYRLMDCTGDLSGAANTTPNITGLELADGAAASVVTTPGSGGSVNLIVTAPAPLKITGTSLAGNQLTLTGSGGVPLEGFAVMTATNVSLPIANWSVWKFGTFDGSGNFLVTGTINPTGGAKSFFRVRVGTNDLGSPIITVQPVNLIVAPGQDATFSVTAIGAAPLFYQWYYNTNTAKSGETNATLTLSNVQTNQAGKYSVIVSNQFGAANSVFATLSVGDGPDFSLVGWATVPALGLTTTTGGAGGATVTVSNATDFLAAIANPNPLIIRVSGNIALSGMHDVTSHKTIEGLGANSGITGGGLNVGLPIDDIITSPPANAVKNVIIRNLTFSGSSVDGINIQMFSHHVWVDHCTFTDPFDGALDFKRGSDYVTFSYNHFYHVNKTSLVGHADDNQAQSSGRLHATYHNNWFEVCQQRQPRVRYGHVHLFNNYYEGYLDYAIGMGVEANVYAENNYFFGTGGDAYQFYIVGQQWYIASTGHLYEGDFGLSTDNPPPGGEAWLPSTFYSYTPQSAAWVKANLKSFTGVGKGPFAP